MRKTPSKRKLITGTPANIPLDSSLTSIEWLPNMQIGDNSSSSSSSTATTTTIIPMKQSLPITTNIQEKLEATEIESPTTTVHDNIHVKPPYSYVTLIRQAILSTRAQRMTLNDIYQWIVDSYPYFRAAPPKWKNSIRHNLSLNKCFKRLQRSTNDPGKGSYWAVEESFENNKQMNSRKPKFDEVQSPTHIFPSSPAGLIQQQPGFFPNNNPIIYGDICSVGGQSTSTDESDSTMSFTANSNSMPWDDINMDLTASFRRFRDQVLNVPSNVWTIPTDSLSVNPNDPTYWSHDLFSNGDTTSFLESIKLASSGNINWKDFDVGPYCEFLEDFRTNPTFQPQDRDKLITLASSLSSFFDHTGITNLAQSRIANDLNLANQLPIVTNPITSQTLNNTNSLPVVNDDGSPFNWDLITD